MESVDRTKEITGVITPVKELENELIRKSFAALSLAREWEEIRGRIEPLCEICDINFHDFMEMLYAESATSTAFLYDLIDIYRERILQDPDLVKEEVDNFIKGVRVGVE